MIQADGAVLVVVCHYNARPPRMLVNLLDQARAVPAGHPFRVRVVVNLANPTRLLLPPRCRDAEVVYRDNAGFNIGAWEHGWRLGPPHAGYLFLQEECRIVREGWVEAFARRASEPSIGLVGECLSPTWDAPWDELARRFAGESLPGHHVAGRPADRVPCYLDFLRREGIPQGLRGDHLQSLVLFATREVLEAAGGFPVGRSYGEAIAAEIGISKKVQALGLRIAEVGPVPFSYIEHPQWLHRRAESAAP
jgi:hypothetical protein